MGLTEGAHSPPSARQAFEWAVAELLVDHGMPPEHAWPKGITIAARVLDTDPPLAVLAAEYDALAAHDNELRAFVANPEGAPSHQRFGYLRGQRDARTELRADLAPLLVTHQPFGGDFGGECKHDGFDWPCPTIRSLPDWLRPEEPTDG